MPAPKQDESGFSLIEIMISMAVVSVGALMALSLMVSSMSLELDTRQTNAETADTRSLVENIEGMEFGRVWATYNADPADDPDGAGTASGSSYVRDLAMNPGARSILPTGGGGTLTHVRGTAARSAQMTPGRRLRINIDMPVDVNGNLNEQEAANLLGTAVDINADGAIDNGSRAGDHKAVPMVIEVEAEGARGRRKTIRIPRIRIERGNGQ